MADIYSAECLEGFCSQCDVPSCACLHHLEDEESDTDRDYDEEEDDFDDEDQFDEDCGMTRDGSCTMIGTEFCDWMCRYSGSL